MYEVSKCAPQEALGNLDKAYAKFFRRVKLLKEGKLKGKVWFPKCLVGLTTNSESYVKPTKKGSKRREITRLQIAKLHFRISNIRKDAMFCALCSWTLKLVEALTSTRHKHIHKATSEIVAKSKPQKLRPSACVIEDLNVAGMSSPTTKRLMVKEPTFEQSDSWC